MSLSRAVVRKSARLVVEGLQIEIEYIEDENASLDTLTRVTLNTQFLRENLKLVVAMILLEEEDRFTFAKWAAANEFTQEENEPFKLLCKTITEEVDYEALFWRQLFEKEPVYCVFGRNSRGKVYMVCGTIKNPDKDGCVFCYELSTENKQMEERVNWLRLLPRNDFNLSLYRDTNQK
jgi:hypothetical protein